MAGRAWPTITGREDAHETIPMQAIIDRIVRLFSI
jgi:hypothetical protein